MPELTTETTERRGLFVPPNMPKSIPAAVKTAMDDINKVVNTVRKEQASPLLTGLVGHVKTAWEAAKNGRQTNGVDDLLVTCLNLKRGKYDSNTLAKIRAATPGGSEVFMMLTNVKSRACEAILKSTYSSGVDKFWRTDPTPIPELPQAHEVKINEQIIGELTQFIVQNGEQAITDQNIDDYRDEIRAKALKQTIKDAKLESRRIDQQIEDQLVQGKFYDAFSEFITDISTFPTAFLKGPVIRSRPRIVWTEDQNGNSVPGVEIKPAREYYSPNPFDIYPSPGAKNLQDGDLCERHRLRRADLVAMIGVKGYKEDAIRAVLKEYGRGGLRTWLASDTRRAFAEGRPDEIKDPEPQIDAVEYWGSAQGSQLIEWGMDKKSIPDPESDYQINAWLIGNYLIMARLNPHPLNRRPYYSASYSTTNDSIWGESPPMLMKDTQNICNAVARALLNRMAWASGPIAEIFMDRLAPGEDPTNLKPWMLLKTKSDVTGRASSKALYITDMDPHSDIFLKVYDYFFKQASEQTGIPNYAYGQGDSSQSHKTSSGLAMLMNATNTLLRNVVLGIDNRVVKEVIREHHLNIMLYDQDVPKAGDINIIARASEYLLAQEQMQLRRNEALESTNNPWDERIIGDKGRAAMLRENFKSLKYDVGEIVPDADSMEQREREMMQQLIARIEELEAQVGAELGGGGASPPKTRGGGGSSPKRGLAVMDDAGGRRGVEPSRTMQ